MIIARVWCLFVILGIGLFPFCQVSPFFCSFQISKFELGIFVCELFGNWGRLETFIYVWVWTVYARALVSNVENWFDTDGHSFSQKEVTIVVFPGQDFSRQWIATYGVLGVKKEFSWMFEACAIKLVLLISCACFYISRSLEPALSLYWGHVTSHWSKRTQGITWGWSGAFFYHRKLLPLDLHSCLCYDAFLLHFIISLCLRFSVNFFTSIFYMHCRLSFTRRLELQLNKDLEKLESGRSILCPHRSRFFYLYNSSW